MNTETTAATAASIAHRAIKLPAIGTMLPHLSGAFWGVQRARPSSGQADYALIVPPGPEFERREVAWGSEGVDEPGAACQWDGLANTQALLASGNDHPMLADLPQVEAIDGLSGLYLPSLCEGKTLFANGCDAFDPKLWYWLSTQFSRNSAFSQYFNLGSTLNFVKSWSGGAARFVRRCSLELLIP